MVLDRLNFWGNLFIRPVDSRHYMTKEAEALGLAE
jgi:hypothetical protein